MKKRKKNNNQIFSFLDESFNVIDLEDECDNPNYSGLDSDDTDVDTN